MHNNSLRNVFSGSDAIHIGTDDMRKKMGEILDCVYLRGDEFLIERKNKPLAILMPVEKHRAFVDMAKRYLMDSLEKTNPALSQEEVDILADEAKHASRKSKLKK